VDKNKAEIFSLLLFKEIGYIHLIACLKVLKNSRPIRVEARNNTFGVGPNIVRLQER
jgi:hypothetical protein